MAKETETARAAEEARMAREAETARAAEEARRAGTARTAGARLGRYRSFRSQDT